MVNPKNFRLLSHGELMNLIVVSLSSVIRNMILMNERLFAAAEQATRYYLPRMLA